MKQVIRTERGWPGHFICANKCFFHRNTLLQCEDINIVVSTVGAYQIYDYINKKTEYEPIGSENRYYETMAFHAEYDGTYWDSDIGRQIYACPLKWTVNNIEFESDKEANDMHEAIVDWYTERLIKGDKFEIERDGLG